MAWSVGPKSGFNAFSNDGSFLEQFRKMQEHQRQEPASSTAGDTSKKPGTVSMKLGALKKEKEVIRLKPTAASVNRMFGDDSSDSEGEGEKSRRKEDGRSTAHTQAISTSHSSTSHSSTSHSSTSHSHVSTSHSSTSHSHVSTSHSSTPHYSHSHSSTSHSFPDSSSAREGSSSWSSRKRKSGSRWTSAPSTDDLAIAEAMASFSNPSSQELTEAQKIQLKEQLEMNKLVAELRSTVQKKPHRSGRKKNKHEYDSDEDTEGGTWEHKARTKEMMDTKEKAQDLTERARGKHHIGDFLPPEELDKFVEKVMAVKEGREVDLSDYREHKLTEENVGFKMLKKAGWKEGTGLGSKEEGIVAPINKGKQSFDQAGVGVEQPAEVVKEDDMFEVYRKRMMLAYRFRPNPLNNPRRPYY